MNFKSRKDKTIDYYNCFKSCYDPGFTEGDELYNCVNKCNESYKYNTRRYQTYYNKFREKVWKLYETHLESYK